MRTRIKTKDVLPNVLLSMILIFASWNFITYGQTAQTNESLKKKQQEFLTWKFGIFLHFNMATFYNEEWANGYEDPGLFNPSQLDCGQWADAARAAGMKYGILTVKHTGGWCLWDSQYTSHDITCFTNFRNGNGDLVKEFTDAFRARDLKVGLYYCLPGNYSNRFGNKLECEKPDLHGLFPEALGDYEWYIEKQVEELLTKYGKIDLFWFDQYSNPYTGKYWQQLKKLVHKLQPDCIVLANNSASFDETDIIGFEYPYLKSARPGHELPGVGNTEPSEVCDCIDERGWFWHPGGEKVKTVEDIVNMVRLCISRNANYLLDVPPDNKGILPAIYVNQLKLAGEDLK